MIALWGSSQFPVLSAQNGKWHPNLAPYREPDRVWGEAIGAD